MWDDPSLINHVNSRPMRADAACTVVAMSRSSSVPCMMPQKNQWEVLLGSRVEQSPCEVTQETAWTIKQANWTFGLASSGDSHSVASTVPTTKQWFHPNRQIAVSDRLAIMQHVACVLVVSMGREWVARLFSNWPRHSPYFPGYVVLFADASEIQKVVRLFTRYS